MQTPKYFLTTLITGAAFASALAAVPAVAETITFEEQGMKSCCFSDEPPLTNQYAGSGVVFDGGWEVLNQSGNFGVDAISGEHFAAYNTSVSGVTDTIGMTFASGISSISGYLGSVFAGTWDIVAYLNGAMVSSTSVSNGVSEYTSFLLSGSFDYVTITGSAVFGVL